MDEVAVTLESLFEAPLPPAQAPLFDLDRSCRTCCASEEENYKQLILDELARQHMPVTALAVALGKTRQGLQKILKGSCRLTDDVRDQIFRILGIDRTRAIMSVALFRETNLYHEHGLYISAESFKSTYHNIVICRAGGIHVELRASIIHEAATRGYDALLVHQERVLAREAQLLD